MENNLIVVQAQIIKDTSAHNYQKLLQAAEDIHFDKETLNQDYLPLKELREIKKRIEDLENPYTAAWKLWNESKASVLNPIKDVLTRKGNEFTVLATQIKTEQQLVEKNNKRINDIKTLIQNTSIRFSTQIAAAENIEELVRIEKAIGSEQTKKQYQEFVPQLIIELEKLKPLITAQKGNFKELDNVKNKQQAVNESGNDEEIIMWLDSENIPIEKIESIKTEVQHVALNSAINQTTEVESESTTVLPKAKRTTWEYEITEWDLFKKNYPQFIKCEPDHEKIKEMIKQEKDGKRINERTVNGLKIYLKSTY